MRLTTRSTRSGSRAATSSAVSAISGARATRGRRAGSAPGVLVLIGEALDQVGGPDGAWACPQTAGCGGQALVQGLVGEQPVDRAEQLADAGAVVGRPVGALGEEHDRRLLPGHDRKLPPR